jgi:hypothetical protein
LTGIAHTIPIAPQTAKLNNVMVGAGVVLMF